MSNKKILFGVCGIGRGHTYRQFPVISYFAKKQCKIVIFAFDESYDFYSLAFKYRKNIKIYQVFVPWIHGGVDGIDYKRTANENFNKNQNCISLNFSAMNKALDFLGKPDLVISDYEPISAQFAYSLDAKFITIDQQSKFFNNGYFDTKNGISVAEERSRLGLFFPRADRRIACSFFIPPSKQSISGNFKVEIIPPVIREEISQLRVKNKKDKFKQNNILIYLSPYSQFTQSPNDVFKILSQFPDYCFRLFISKKSDFFNAKNIPSNVIINSHGSGSFFNAFNESGSVVCTAGHTFISEAMYLRKPVYAIPLNTYEQKYNAEIIDKYKFGITRNKLEIKSLRYFLEMSFLFKKNIINDDKILLNKKRGQKYIIGVINKLLLQS